MRFIARHITGLAATISIVLCFFLVVWGYKAAFNQKLALQPDTYHTTEVSDLVIAYHNRLHTPNLTQTLSATLSPDRPISRLAYFIHLLFTSRGKMIQAYLHHTQFGLVQSFKNASQYYFGVHYSKLTTGEILLLCDLAQGADLPINDPTAALKRRDELLADLYNRGFIPFATYHTERNRALSLSADHRPIN